MCKSERFICPSFLALGHEDCKNAHKAWKVNCSRAGSYSALASCRWVCKWRTEKKWEKKWEMYRGRNESGQLTANWWSSGMACFQDAARHRFQCQLLLVTSWGRAILLHRRYKHPGLKRLARESVSKGTLVLKPHIRTHTLTRIVKETRG